MGSKLARYLTHPKGRDDRAATGEHPEGKAEDAGTRGQLAVQRYAAVERSEERVYVPPRETCRLQVLECRDVRLPVLRTDPHCGCSRHHFERTELIPEGGRIGEERWDERLRVTQGVGEDALLRSPVDDHTRVEAPEVERFVVEVPPCDRIRRKVNLEAPVEQKPLLLVSPHSATDTVRRLEDGDLGSAFSEYLCAGKAGQSGPDDNDLHTRESVAHNSEDTVVALTKGDSIYGCYRTPAVLCVRHRA